MLGVVTVEENVCSLATCQSESNPPAHKCAASGVEALLKSHLVFDNRSDFLDSVVFSKRKKGSPIFNTNPARRQRVGMPRRLRIEYLGVLPLAGALLLRNGSGNGITRFSPGHAGRFSSFNCCI